MMNIRNFIILFGMVLATSGLAAETPKPNVVIIYGDDVGFGDVGVYGSKKGVGPIN
jgi:arylsulfatase A